VKRLPQTIIVLALLAATATAFAVTERLKLEKSPLTGTKVDKIFSPICECSHHDAVISFRLRKQERVTVDILDSRGQSVATLVRDQREPKGRVSYTWDGKTEDGIVVSEGIYRPRVRLREHGRVFVLPNPIRVDTTAPRIELTRVAPRVFSPGIDGGHDRIAAWYKTTEPAHAIMLVDGKQRVLSRFRSTKGRLQWFGVVDGKPVPPGKYRIELRAFDRAGNTSTATRSLPVRVFYIAFRRSTVHAVAGKRFSIGVVTHARRYQWFFFRKHGSSRKRVLVLRAPRTPGRYAAYVYVRSHADKAEVVVAPAK
jgi:FlgD Ig-like domain